MPSCYAHFRFGDRALPGLGSTFCGPIQRHRKLYDLGQQGPDFFFYYRLGRDTPVRSLARQYHSASGEEVFGRICRELDRPTEEELAYLYGLAGHYCLDALCHPLINQRTQGDLVHNAMESEFDRFLLQTDGVARPWRYHRGKPLQCSRAQSRVIARFYSEAEEAQIRQSLNTMEAVLGLLTIHGGAKLVLRCMGGANPGLLMDKEPDGRFASSNRELLELFLEAQARYRDYLQQLHSHIYDRKPLGKEFRAIFG